MKIWIRLIAIFTGIYNFAIGGNAILALAQIMIFAIGFNELGLPLSTGRFVAGLGGILLIIHSVRLILGFQSAQRLQPWLRLSAIAKQAAHHAYSDMAMPISEHSREYASDSGCGCSCLRAF